MKKNLKNIDFRSKKGMTLTELLIGIAVGAAIMIATITLVNYSFTAYSSTQNQITNDSGLHDTTDIVNKYIREAEYCTVQDDHTLYIAISDYVVGGETLKSTDIRFIYDESAQTILLDKMDGTTPPLIIAKYVTSVKWEVYNNGVRYKINQKTIYDDEEFTINGFAYCRGR